MLDLCSEEMLLLIEKAVLQQGNNIVCSGRHRIGMHQPNERHKEDLRVCLGMNLNTKESSS